MAFPSRLPFRNGDRILFQGDSITDAGRRQTTTGLGHGYVAIIQGWVAAHFPHLAVEIINRGVSGDRTTELLARWEEDCLKLQPTWLSIMIGVNDVWRRRQEWNGQTHIPLPEYTANYRELLSRARAAGIRRLVLMSPTLIDKDLNSDLNTLLADYDRAVQELAAEFGAVYVPVRRRLIEVITAQPHIDWLPDGCHPSVAGHAVIAAAWLQAVAAAAAE